MKYVFLVLGALLIAAWTLFGAAIARRAVLSAECRTDVYLLTSHSPEASCGPGRDVTVVSHGDGAIVTCSCASQDIDPPLLPSVRPAPTIL